MADTVVRSTTKINMIPEENRGKPWFQVVSLVGRKASTLTVLFVKGRKYNFYDQDGRF
jgi:hypothetical protein